MTTNNSDLKSIDNFDIESNIYHTLCANPDTVFDQYTLYDKIICDNYSTSFINSDFKYKFLLTIRKLPILYENINIKIVDKCYFLLINNTLENIIIKFFVNKTYSFVVATIQITSELVKLFF